MEKHIAVLPGDGVGPEVMSGTVKVLKRIAERFGHQFRFHYGSIGGESIDQYGVPLTKETLEMCRKCDAVLLGAVGGPKWDQLPSHKRPEKGLLQLRKELQLFANIRPVKACESLYNVSPLKNEVIQDVDVLIVRELTSGLYFGTPKGRSGQNGDDVVDTLYYHRTEIERVVKKAFELAKSRRKKLTSVDKANVLESSRMWREVVEKMKQQFPEVEVEHLLVDAAAMKLLRDPRSFDVIVTENMFGDILSDEASVIVGSLGMLPSASLREDRFGLYEPVHGSAPDIAGKNQANPIGMLLSAAMMLRYSFGMTEEADAVEKAVNEVLTSGVMTRDVATLSNYSVSTSVMIHHVLDQLEEDHAIAGIMAAYA
ncbi:MAG: 3-isopropylmalate dehydrogenase [Bacillus sp. (in: Bacteria)]|nr:3-isopropylmalate dehydrogenase [Bacillus sp. (in: firmicutes)]